MTIRQELRLPTQVPLPVQKEHNTASTVPHNTWLHEIGHALGLPHPGGVGNDAGNYYADPESLMGVGNTLRLDDHNHAFCSQIQAKGLDKKCPWKSVSVFE